MKTLNSWTPSCVKLNVPSSVVGRTRTHTQLKAQECPGSTVVLDHQQCLVGKSSHPQPMSDDTSQLLFSLNCLSVHVLQHRMLLISSPRHSVRTKEQPGINSSKNTKSNTGAVLLLWAEGSEKVNLHQVFVKEIPVFHTEDTISTNNSSGWCCLSAGLHTDTLATKLIPSGITSIPLGISPFLATINYYVLGTYKD